MPLYRELAESIGNLFEQNRQEASVHVPDTPLACKFREPSHQAGRVFGIGDKADSRRLERS